MRVSINYSTLQGKEVPNLRDESFEGSRAQAHARALKTIETKRAAAACEFFTLIWSRPKEETPPFSKKTLCMQSYHHTGRPAGPVKFIRP